MEPVVRALVVYLFLLLIFRISGKRTLSESSSFDLVLLLIISETTQQAMVDGDHSMTNAALLIVTLVGLDILLSFIKQWSPAAEAWLDGLPLIILRQGKPIDERMQRERVDEADILEASRETCGLESLDQIKYAVLERHGDITIVPKEGRNSPRIQN
jgi:uncharacterized membrane protein YcaP (DUF421 family)